MMKLVNILLVLATALIISAAPATAQNINGGSGPKIRTMSDVPATGFFFKSCPTIPIFIWNYADAREQARFGQGTALPTKSDQPAISHSIIFCTDTFIKLNSIPFILKFSALMSGVASTILVLAILIFSFKVFLGQANIRSISFSFFLKILLVFTIIGSNPIEAATGGLRLLSIKDTLIHAPRHFSAKIIEALYDDNANITSPLNAVSTVYSTVGSIADLNGGTLNSIFSTHTISFPSFFGIDLPSVNITIDPPSFFETGLPFQLFDKHLASILDLKQIENTVNKMRATKVGVAAVITGLLFTGDFAAMLSIVMLTYIVIMIVALAQSILFFITANLILTILLALTPVILPCILIPRTANLTKRWFMAIISYTLQPMIFMAFFAVIVLLLDKVSDPVRHPGGTPTDIFYNAAWNQLMNKCKETGATADNPCTKKNTIKFGINSLDGLFNEYSKDAEQFRDNTFNPPAASQDKDAKETAINYGLDFSKDKVSTLDPATQNTVNAIKVVDQTNPAQVANARALGQSIITQKDIMQAMAYIISIIVLLSILVSFIQLIPSIVENMVGKAAPAAFDVVKELTNPLEKVTGFADEISSGVRSKIKQTRQQQQEENSQSTNRP